MSYLSSVRELRPRVSFALGIVTAGIAGACSDSIQAPALNPTTIEAITPMTLAGIVDAEITPLPTVRVRDVNGKPVQGIQVTFRLTTGSGTLGNSASTTDVDGLARTKWTLGRSVGVTTLAASSSGLPDIVFTAVTTAGPAFSLLPVAVAAPRTGMAGRPQLDRPSVVVQDRFGNPVARVTVTFSVISGGGTIEGATVITDDLGEATPGSWTLGSIGPNVMSAAVAGLPSTSITVVALSVLGVYDLESIVLGTFVLKPESRIVLGDGDQFTTEFEGAFGRGTYVIANDRIVLTYANDFLRALRASHDYSPGAGAIEDAKETGIVSGLNITLYRCWTEDCYDSYWTYRRVAP